MKKSIIWNFKAKLYQQFRNQFPFGYFLQQENKSLAALLTKIPPKFKIVLDLGTGEGNALQFVANHVTKIGVDSSLSMLVNAHRKINAAFINCDLLHLSLKNNIADIVLIIGVLEYFSNLDPIFHEINRVTTKDSYVIISYSPPNIWTFLRQFIGHRIYSIKLKKMIEIIEKNGFEIIKPNKGIMQHQILIKKKAGLTI